MATWGAGEPVDHWIYRRRNADSDTQLRGVELRLFQRSARARVGSGRGLCGFGFAVLRLHRVRPVAGARSFQSQRARENELCVWRRGFDDSDSNPRAPDYAVVLQGDFSDMVAADRDAAGVHWSRTWRAFPQAWKTCSGRTAGAHRHSVADPARLRFLGG